MTTCECGHSRDQHVMTLGCRASECGCRIFTKRPTDDGLALDELVPDWVNHSKREKE